MELQGIMGNFPGSMGNLGKLHKFMDQLGTLQRNMGIVGSYGYLQRINVDLGEL